jgi:ABC-2 type transport system permease protein
MVFVFTFPLMFLVLFSAIFSDSIQGPPGSQRVTVQQYYVAGMLASGIASSTFVNLAMSIAMEQHNGLLKRLGGAPLPKASYFIGKVGMSIVISAAQASIMLAAGVVLYDLSLPVDLAHWAVFAWVTVLGVASCTFLGIAMTRLIPNAQSAPAIVQPPYLILQFISGIFVPFSNIPGWLQGLSSAFPLRWMASGYRYAFLPDWFKQEEAGHAWYLAQGAGVLGVWTILGFILCLLFFRWTRKSDG